MPEIWGKVSLIHTSVNRTFNLRGVDFACTGAGRSARSDHLHDLLVQGIGDIRIS